MFGLHNLALDSDFSLESSLELSTLFRARLVRRERLPCQSIAGLVLDLVDYTETAASTVGSLSNDVGRRSNSPSDGRRPWAAPQAAPPRPANGRLDRVLHCGGVRQRLCGGGRWPRGPRDSSAAGAVSGWRIRRGTHLSKGFQCSSRSSRSSRLRGPSAAVATVALPLVQDPDFYLFEFACHEGTTGACARCSAAGDSRG